MRDRKNILTTTSKIKAETIAFFDIEKYAFPVVHVYFACNLSFVSFEYIAIFICEKLYAA